MSDSNTEKLAFPAPNRIIDGETQFGMTLRDYFAAKAMQGDVTRVGYYSPGERMLMAAKNAYAMADAMLEAREQ